MINLPNHLPSGKEQNMKVNQFDNVPTREDAVFLIETSIVVSMFTIMEVVVVAIVVQAAM